MSMTPRPARGVRRAPRPGWLALAVWRNPLARGTDRTEAGIAIVIICVWLLSLPIVATAGSLCWAKLSAIAADEQRTRTQTTATLTADATNFLFSEHGIPMTGRFSVPARWVAPDGSERTGTIDTAGNAKAVDTEQIWVDGSGNDTPPPMTGTAAAVLLIVVTAGAWLMIGALLGAGWLVLRSRLNRRRFAAWDHDWQQVEPLWSGRRR